MKELKKKYSELNDYELINIVYFESSEYTEEAIKVAKSVLEERGLSQPSEEMLHKAKEYKDSPVSDYDSDLLGKNIFEKGKLEKAVEKRDYFFIGKWLFWLVIGFSLYSAHTMCLPNSTYEMVAQQSGIPIWIIFIKETIYTIAIFGMIPVVFFCIYSLRLSKEQRKEKGLFLLMPIYVFIIYGISAFIFLLFL